MCSLGNTRVTTDAFADGRQDLSFGLYRPALPLSNHPLAGNNGGQSPAIQYISLRPIKGKYTQFWPMTAKLKLK